MSATGESEVPAVEVPPAEATVMEEPKKDEKEKPVKEKKARAPRVPKEKKPKEPKTASHPPYFQMIKEALLTLNEKNGSSPYAIAKYMEDKHKAVLPANFRKILGLQLKNSAARGKLIKIKASYKLSEAGKREKVKANVAKAGEVKKPRQAKSTTVAAQKARPARKSEKTKKAAKPAKKVGAKKAKKTTPAKPKQPKSIKSPAAKRARKAVAA